MLVEVLGHFLCD